jgi:hypothetical protein
LDGIQWQPFLRKALFNIKISLSQSCLRTQYRINLSGWLVCYKTVTQQWAVKVEGVGGAFNRSNLQFRHNNFIKQENKSIFVVSDPHTVSGEVLGLLGILEHFQKISSSVFVFLAPCKAGSWCVDASPALPVLLDKASIASPHS